MDLDLNTTQAINESSNRSVVYWICFFSILMSFQILSYFLYRLAAYYCKWKRDEKSIYQVFEELVKLTVLTFLYIFASNYMEAFNCSINKIIVEFGIPYLFTLLIFGFFCELSYFKVRLVDIMSWKLATWIGFISMLSVLLFLIIANFATCVQKILFFVPIIPCIIYFLSGYLITLFAHNPSYHFHPRPYQIIFSVCLLRKENSFYSRLFAGICAGVFVRSVAANPMLSLLDPVMPSDERVTLDSPDNVSIPYGNALQLSQPILNSTNVAEDDHPVSVSIPDRKDDITEHEQNISTGTRENYKFLDDNDDDSYLRRIEQYNRGESSTTPPVLNHGDPSDAVAGKKNEKILHDDENEATTAEFLKSSRSSDYGDWNEKQKGELLGDYM